METGSLESFVRALPKAELHLHLEGTLEAGLMLALARRNGVSLRFTSEEQVREALRFTDLQSFLDLYYEAARVLLTRRDFRDLTVAYLERAHADGVRHVEPFFDPQTHTARGVSFDDVVGGICDGLDEGRERLGVTSGLIMCFLRHLDEADAEKTLDQATPHLDKLIAVGLDSGERGNPPEKFARVFARARGLGLRVVAHAGEEGPPAYVVQALDVLGARRIDHGVRSIEDPSLVERLVRQGVPLTVCPLSNVRLCVYRDMASHPLKRLFEAGVKVTINSDDPAYFGGYVVKNYVDAALALGLRRVDLVRIARASFEASFVGDETRAQHLEALGKVEAALTA